MAQGIGGVNSPLIARLPFLGRIFEYNVPGLANPSSPFVFPPYVQAEMSVKPLFVFSTQQSFQASRQGISLDLHKDFGIDDQFILVEFMARGQVGSLSVRANYDAYLTNLTSGLGHVDWPPFRTGLDFDLVSTRTVRFGVNADVVWMQPVFSGVLPVLGTRSIKWDRPVTVGLQASLNPPGWGGLSFSFDSRVRWPITQKSRVTQLEIGAGVRTPETVLGSTAVRAGWRYTVIDLHNTDDFQLDLTWSGIYAELVYFY